MHYEVIVYTDSKETVQSLVEQGLNVAVWVGEQLWADAVNGMIVAGSIDEYQGDELGGLLVHASALRSLAL